MENFSLLDLYTLSRLYSEQAHRLKTALLDGASWEEVQEFRHQVVELETALFNRIRHGNINPAEQSKRKTGEAEEAA